MSRCVIIASAPVQNTDHFQHFIREGDYIICADGGYDSAINAGITPKLIVGDFDSVKHSLPGTIEKVRLPSHKDDTDTICAIQEGLNRGCGEFLILGGIGGRLDHTLANVCALDYLAERNIPAKLADEKNEAFLVKSENSIALTDKTGATLSVLPFGCPYCTVTYTGLEYPLDHYSIQSSVPLGISNRVLTENATITVHIGTALIILSQD